MDFAAGYPLAQHVFPLLRAAPLTAGHGALRQLLSQRQRRVLSSVATRITFGARHVVYHAGAPAVFIFVCDEGALKSYRELPSGRQRIATFLFREDIFGLAENGVYVNTVKTLRPTTCHRVPIETLVTMLQRDGELGWMFLVKITHELRQAQRRAILLARRSAVGRLTMFLTGLEGRNRDPDRAKRHTISLPMSRTDIADYLGLTLESVSRAFARLAREKVIALDGKTGVRILDWRRLDRLAYDV
jgi:CRP/FNR family transcriptional regulator